MSHFWQSIECFETWIRTGDSTASKSCNELPLHAELYVNFLNSPKDPKPIDCNISTDLCLSVHLGPPRIPSSFASPGLCMELLLFLEHCFLCLDQCYPTKRAYMVTLLKLSLSNHSATFFFRQFVTVLYYLLIYYFYYYCYLLFISFMRIGTVLFVFYFVS